MSETEIILLPGFMGVHLKGDREGRVWLDFGAMLRGDLAEKLALDPTGAEDAIAGEHILPDGLIEAIYGELVSRMRDAGLVVHEFPFDFRRSLLAIGLSLRAFIDERARRAPGKRFALVGHSMGGLVAAIYASYDPAFSERIARTILLGAPLGGTFDTVEAVTGTHWVLPRLARLTRGDNILEFQRSIGTWPGLYSLLPDIDLFPEAARLFAAQGWPSGLEPAQRWLDEARAMKEVIRSTPLYSKPTAQLLSLGYRTVDRFIVNGSAGIAAGPRIAKGDGTVVGRTGMPAGVSGYRVDFPHSLMPLDPKAIQGVIDLVLRGSTQLAPIAPEDLEGELEDEETPVADMLGGVLGSLTGDLVARLALLFSPV